MKILDSKPVDPQDIYTKTKAVYIDQHKQYLIDRDLFHRFYSYAVNPSSYDLKPADFKDKVILDAGCGNSAYFQKAMHDLGAQKIECLDIGSEWINPLKAGLIENELDLNRFGFSSGSTTEIPFPDNTFDFVASNGVIMHLPSVEEATKAVNELYRVTKQGGNLYIYFGVDKPGIVDNYIVPALRKAYREDNSFRHLIDSATPEAIQAMLRPIIEAFEKNDALYPEGMLDSFTQLITLDTTTFLKNMLQVPVQQGNDLDWDFAYTVLQKLGATEIRRCPQHYFARKDIRRFLTPFHVTGDCSEISKVLYGGGHLKVTCRKSL